MRQQAVQMQGFGARLQGIRVLHDPPSSIGHRSRARAAVRPVARLDVRGQRHGDGRGRRLLAMAFEREANRVRVRYITFKRLEDSGLELAGLIAFEDSTRQR